MFRQKLIGRPTRLQKIWFGSVLFFVAFCVRLLAINRYVTPDELIWVFRSAQFRQAFLTGQWLETLTAGHPGVTTTWLGSLGLSLQIALQPSTSTHYRFITQLAWFAPENTAMFDYLATFLTSGRILLALVNSMGVVAVFSLGQRLYGRTPAILAALLLALDPFVAGLSGLLHVDSLLTIFATLSLLALALTITTLSGRHACAWAILSGITAGLAILSKSPALLLPPFAAFFLLIMLFSRRQLPFQSRLGRMFAQGACWSGSYLLTIFTLFPALWASPLQVAQKMSQTSNRHIEEALRPSYFLGQTAYEQGALFYPLTLSFRLSPVVFCGLILAAFLMTSPLFRALFRNRRAPLSPAPPLANPWRSPATWIFILWPLLFLAAISLAAKKFDRYALPAVPSLIILASLGWVYLPALKTRLPQALFVLAGIQGLFLAWAMPYPLTAVNPLLGGPAIAQRVFDVGWGEAESAAARWLSTTTDASQRTLFSWIAPAVAPFFPGQTLPAQADALRQADYLILPLNGRDPPPPHAILLHTIQFNGLARAAIYRQPEPAPALAPAPLPAPVTFGDVVRLSGIGTAVHDEQIEIILRWQLARPSNGRYHVKLTLGDDQGQQWATQETVLLNELYFYPEHWVEGKPTETRYTLALPPGLPPAEYQLEVALFDAVTQAQLPVMAVDNLFQGMSHTVGGMQIARRDPPPTALAFAPPITQMAVWLDGRLHLLASADFPPPLVVTGDELVLDLYWRASSSLPAGLQVEVRIGEQTVRQPLSRFDTGSWRPGEMIHEKTAVPIPTNMPGGIYLLAIQPLTAGGQPLGEASAAGPVEVVALERQFTLPANMSVLRADSFGGQMTLRGLEMAHPDSITLYWQVAKKPDRLLTAFIHLLDENNQIVAQSDQWPGGLPAPLSAAGQVISDLHILNAPPDLPPGAYALAVGLYDPATGQRLPAFDADGRAHPHNQVLLPSVILVESGP